MNNGFVKNEIFKFFSNVISIDITKDKVEVFNITNDSLDTCTTLSFFDYMEKMKTIIHPDDLKMYFDNLSSYVLDKNGGTISYGYRLKNNSGHYDNYINLVTKINNANTDIMLVFTLKDESVKKVEKNDNNDNLDDYIKAMSSRVSDTILKIYNTLDNVYNNMGNDYIKILLEKLLHDFPEFNTQFQQDITFQVNKTKSSLLIVDDDMMTRNLLKKTFSDDYDVVLATNGQEAIAIIEKDGINNIDGIFLDLLMPVLDGFAVLDYLRDKNVLSKVPVIIISGIEDKETRQKVYKYNIADLLEKPFNLEIIKYRTTNLINLYKTSTSLSNIIMSQKNNLLTVSDEIVKSYLYDNKEKITKVKEYLLYILEELKQNKDYKLDDYTINKILEASEFYNIGLYIIPRHMGKNGTFSDYELELIKSHPKFGQMLINEVLKKRNDTNLLKYANDIVLNCYEKYDGSGYPNGIEKDKIPIWAQATSLAALLEIALSNNKNLSIEEITNKYFSDGSFSKELIDLLPKVLEKIKNN